MKKVITLYHPFLWLNNAFTSPHGLQMLPQDLPRSAVGRQVQESISVQTTQLTALQASEVRGQTVESELGLAPVQPVVDLPL